MEEVGKKAGRMLSVVSTAQLRATQTRWRTTTPSLLPKAARAVINKFWKAPSSHINGFPKAVENWLSESVKPMRIELQNTSSFQEYWNK
jgi:hypothetical protein